MRSSLRISSSSSFLLNLLFNTMLLGISDFIYDLRMHGATVSRSLSLLKDLKCVEERREEFNRRVFTLTSKGLKIAEKIKEIEKILEEE